MRHPSTFKDLGSLFPLTAAVNGGAGGTQSNDILASEIPVLNVFDRDEIFDLTAAPRQSATACYACVERSILLLVPANCRGPSHESQELIVFYRLLWPLL